MAFQCMVNMVDTSSINKNLKLTWHSKFTDVYSVHIAGSELWFKIIEILQKENINLLTHFRLNKFPHSIYWMSPISILGMPG